MCRLKVKLVTTSSRWVPMTGLRSTLLGRRKLQPSASQHLLLWSMITCIGWRYNITVLANWYEYYWHLIPQPSRFGRCVLQLCTPSNISLRWTTHLTSIALKIPSNSLRYGYCTTTKPRFGTTNTRLIAVCMYDVRGIYNYLAGCTFSLM